MFNKLMFNKLICWSIMFKYMDLGIILCDEKIWDM